MTPVPDHFLARLTKGLKQMHLRLLEERSSLVKKPTGGRVRQGAEEMSHFREGSYDG